MKNVRVWENSGAVLLSSILDWCLKQGNANTLLAVERPSQDASGKYSFDATVQNKAKDLFGKRLLGQLNARGWPGTELIGHTARVHVVKFDVGLRDKMVETQDDLFCWTHRTPNRLPEDICVLRQGSQYPLFASVTHDRDAYFIAPGDMPISGFEITDYEISDMLLAWNGPYFCLVD
jgi:hypothetical protein